MSSTSSKSTPSKQTKPTTEQHTEPTTEQHMEPTANSTPAKRKLDKSWWVLLVAVMIAVFTAIIINLTSSNTDPGDVSGYLDIDNGDQKVNWSRYTTTDIELTSSVTISESGVYHITGTLTDGSITIDVGDRGEVKLILDSVSITNSSGPAISCTSGDDLVIELVGDSTLADSSTYSADLDQDIASTIYSKSDLTFEGDGTLHVTASYQDAIVSKDDLKFTSGTYDITATDDGVRGKDSVYIVGGTFNITAQQDAIKSTNSTDAGKGFVLIEGGDIAISAGDDAVHAETLLTIQDGSLDITTSYEGLEAPKIVINGGNISVVALDDGINAGGNSDATTTRDPMAADTSCELSINGGTVYVNAGGDGIDSNGYVYFTGGSTIVDGPTNNGNSSLDSGAGIVMTGGEVVAVGSSGMAETLGTSSSIYSISIYFSTTQAAGTQLSITDSAGNTIISHTSAKTFSHAAIGTEKFSLGDTYTIYINGTKYQSFLIQDTVTTVGNPNSNTRMIPGPQPR